jgi:hypothetical protein
MHGRWRSRSDADPILTEQLCDQLTPANYSKSCHEGHRAELAVNGLFRSKADIRLSAQERLGGFCRKPPDRNPQKTRRLRSGLEGRHYCQVGRGTRNSQSARSGVRGRACWGGPSTMTLGLVPYRASDFP